jgi:hypothetical protein
MSEVNLEYLHASEEQYRAVRKIPPLPPTQGIQTRNETVSLAPSQAMHPTESKQYRAHAFSIFLSSEISTHPHPQQLPHVLHRVALVPFYNYVYHI